MINLNHIDSNRIYNGLNILLGFKTLEDKEEKLPIIREILLSIIKDNDTLKDFTIRIE